MGNSHGNDHGKDRDILNIWIPECPGYEPPEYGPPKPACIPIFITSHEVSVITVGWGEEVTLNADINSDATIPVSYQWYKEGVAIDGATESTYTFTTTNFDSGRTYSYSVSNPCGADTKDVTLVIPDAPPEECFPYSCDAQAAIIRETGLTMWPIWPDCVSGTTGPPEFHTLHPDSNQNEFNLRNSQGASGISWNSRRYRQIAYAGSWTGCEDSPTYLMGSGWLNTYPAYSCSPRVKDGLPGELILGDKLPNFTVSLVTKGLSLRHDPHRAYRAFVLNTQIYFYTELNNIGNTYIEDQVDFTEVYYGGVYYDRLWINSDSQMPWAHDFPQNFFADEVMTTVRITRGPLSWQLAPNQNYFRALWYAYQQKTYEIAVTPASTGITQRFFHSDYVFTYSTFQSHDNTSLPLDPDRKPWITQQNQGSSGIHSSLYSGGTYNYALNIDRTPGIVPDLPNVHTNKVFIDEGPCTPLDLVNTYEWHEAWLRNRSDYIPPDYCSVYNLS